MHSNDIWTDRINNLCIYVNVYEHKPGKTHKIKKKRTETEK